MENNHFFQKFCDTVSEDLKTYRPSTTLEEKNNLLSKGVYILSKIAKQHTLNVTKDHKKLTDIAESDTKQNLFMFRPLQKGSTPPFPPPSSYDIFCESSSDIYDNYMRTMDYLEGSPIIHDDVELCKDKVRNLCNGSSILCWSNSSILLRQVLSDVSNVKNIEVITYGSPILVPKSNKLSCCLNIYHEDDWILGFISVIYGIDIASLPRDRIIECTEYNDANVQSEFVVFSRNHFGKTDPHRCYYEFFRP